MLFFFFQAEDGIRDYKVTGVQTCALPIFRESAALGDAEVEARAADDRSVALAGIVAPFGDLHRAHDLRDHEVDVGEIGRASCRERVKISVAAGSLRK